MQFNKFWFKEHRVIARNILIVNVVVQLLWNGYGIYTGISIGRAIFNFIGEYITAITLLWVAYGILFSKKTTSTKPQETQVMNNLIIDLFMFLIASGLFGAGVLGYVMGRNAEANRNKKQSAKEDKITDK